MSERLRLRVFKGVSAEDFRRAFSEQVERYGGQLYWGTARNEPREDLRTTHAGTVHTVYLPYLGGADHLLCRLVGGALDVPWIEVRIQEGSLWDYSLCRGAVDVDQFSTLPEYWDPDDHEACQRALGDADLLSQLWGIPKERVHRYLRQWGMEAADDATFHTKLKGRAYPSDKFEYGSIWQMFDFLAALGAIDPMQHGLLHRIIVPPVESLRTAVSSLRN